MTILLALVLSIAGTAPSPILQASTAAPTTRIVNAAAVRMRSTGAADAPVVVQLALGADLTDLDAIASGGWIHVRAATGESGWVLAQLTTAVQEGSRIATIEHLIRERLSRSGDGFPAEAELDAFVNRVSGDLPDAETRARFALLEMQSLAATAKAIPFLYEKSTTTEPFASWLTAHSAALTYDEPGGRWMLSHETLIATYDRYRDTASADDILWYAVETGFGGECETDVTCHIGAASALEGEYLQRESHGRHVNDAVTRITTRLSDVVDFSANNEIFNPSNDCRDAMQAIERLRAILAGTTTPARAAALASLDRIGSRCQAPRP